MISLYMEVKSSTESALSKASVGQCVARSAAVYYIYCGMCYCIR